MFIAEMLFYLQLTDEIIPCYPDTYWLRVMKDNTLKY